MIVTIDYRAYLTIEMDIDEEILDNVAKEDILSLQTYIKDKFHKKEDSIIRIESIYDSEYCYYEEGEIR